MDVAIDLYENDLIEYKTYDSIREDYEYSVKKDKTKDDFEIKYNVKLLIEKMLFKDIKYIII